MSPGVCAKQRLWLALISTPAAISSRRNSVLIGLLGGIGVIAVGQDRPRGRPASFTTSSTGAATSRVHWRASAGRRPARAGR